MTILSLNGPSTIQWSQSPLFQSWKRFAHDISTIARRCFETLKKILSFPLSFLGSKTWSIPGLLFRASTFALKRCFGLSKEPLQEALFPQSGYHFFSEKPLAPDELKPYFPHACSTAFVYGMKEDFIPPGWSVISPKDLDIEIPSLQKEELCFANSVTGFKATILEKDDEIIITFSSIQQDASKKQVCLRNFRAYQMIFGMHPPVLDQADHFIKAARQCSLLKGKKITLSGMCFGGAVASYAALKHELPAVCFNSFQLGGTQQRKIGSKGLSRADNLITHIFTTGDYLNDSPTFLIDIPLSAIGFRTPGNFGCRFEIPSAYKTAPKTHSFILGSIMVYLGHSERTLPSHLNQ